ncbi:hypothetical protein EDD18DRAFT_1414802 [Armillaria luteobubalina]|uniref:Uncharacterized protein n=1 Tax=Armillaria luteobubalina TaxID=153913 RepID=A0AA39PX40_9AGAR|nr:hypothetical protein EDD18DRAFT_1414802 [Armillaria luteobubalina]
MDISVEAKMQLADLGSLHHPANGKPGEPSRPPLQALVILTPDKTKKGLAALHDYTGQVVNVSTKTLSTSEGMIKKTVGSKKKKGMQVIHLPSEAGPPFAQWKAVLTS